MVTFIRFLGFVSNLMIGTYCAIKLGPLAVQIVEIAAILLFIAFLFRLCPQQRRER